MYSINYNNYFYQFLFFNPIINQNFFFNRFSFIPNNAPVKIIRKEIFKVVRGKNENEDNSFLSPESSTLFNNIKNSNSNSEKEKEKEKEKEINFIGNKRSKRKRPRRENNDNIRRKIKRAFFNNALINKLNNKLKSNGSIQYFEKFPQIFVGSDKRINNKKIIDLTLLEIFIKKELYANENKEGLMKYEHNLKVVLSEEIKENEEFKRILNTKLRELYAEYINSDEFNINEINRLKKKKMGDNYINRYKYLAKNLIEYFAQ